MFDFAWSEIALIGVVALIAIGPKDMPVAIRTVARMVKKARRMAGEFQTHVDEMVREANLDEVRGQFNEIRNFDFRGAVSRAVDSDGSIRKTFADDPFKTTPTTPPASPPLVVEAPPAAPDPILAGGDVAVLEAPAALLADEAVENVVTPSVPAKNEAPAFIPPAIACPPVAPAFIPPGTRLHPT